ncbi:MAG: KAP family NTPase [Verrucomicrobiales bacterium]|nr:KAP family NTPase [Verrucomicrobiales bacterium]
MNPEESVDTETEEVGEAITPRKNRDWVHLNDCKEQFRRFFQAEESGVFVLKGEYGCGKTFFITESILKSEEFQRYFSFSSRISLFGVNTLTALEETAMGSLRYAEKGPDVESVDSGFSAAQKALKKAIGIDLQFSVRSLLWAIASNLGFVLVIDDVDRKGDDLSMKEILGFATSITEQSQGKTKVIIVANEGKILGKDKIEWDQLREKFIDFEFTFAPTPKELANAFIDSENLYEVIGDIFQSLNSRNIRAMRKVERHVLNLRKFLGERTLDYPDLPFDEAARYATLFLLAGRDYEISNLPGSLSGEGVHDLFDFLDTERTPEQEQRAERRNRFDHTARKIGFSGHSFWSGIFFSFFVHGSVEEKVLEESRGALSDLSLRERHNKQRDRIDRMAHGSLRDNSRELKTELEKLLKEFAELVSAKDLKSYIRVIEGLGLEGESLWKIWLEGRKDLKISNGAIYMLRDAVPSKYRSLLPELDIADPGEINPLRFLCHIDNRVSDFNEERELPALAEWTSEQWVNWLKELPEEDEIMLYPLLGALREAVQNKVMQGMKGDIARVVEQAMISLGNENPANRWRIETYFPGLLQPSEPPEDESERSE